MTKKLIGIRFFGCFLIGPVSKDFYDVFDKKHQNSSQEFLSKVSVHQEGFIETEKSASVGFSTILISLPFTQLGYPCVVFLWFLKLFRGRTHVRIKGQNLNFNLQTHATPHNIHATPHDISFIWQKFCPESWVHYTGVWPVRIYRYP